MGYEFPSDVAPGEYAVTPGAAPGTHDYKFPSLAALYPERDRFLNVEGLANSAPLVKFWVRDTGPGIPAEVLPKIFQPYFTTKGPRQGTGLGLNIVQRLIKEGDGALHCQTRSNEGTTFTVYLSGMEITRP